MTRGILIAGNESALTAAVEAETATRVERYALALLPDRFSVPQRGEDPGPQPAKNAARIPLEWNPGSPVSARTLVLAAENRLGRVDEAILVCDPPPVRRAGAGFDLADIEILVNDHIKGWFFLIKELAAGFKERGEGILALVYSETGRKNAGPDLLGPTALAVFRSLTGGLLAVASDEPYLTLGFSGTAAGDEAGFAAFILKSIEEGNRRNNGKLHKYGKTGFFK